MLRLRPQPTEYEPASAGGAGCGRRLRRGKTRKNLVFSSPQCPPFYVAWPGRAIAAPGIVWYPVQRSHGAGTLANGEGDVRDAGLLRPRVVGGFLVGCVFLVSALGLPGVAQALILAQWTFHNETVGTCNNNPVPFIDVMGSATADAGSGIVCPPPGQGGNFPNGNPSTTRAWSYRDWHQGSAPSADHYFELSLDFSAFLAPDLQFSFDQNRSNTGPANFEIQYSVGAGPFIAAGSGTTTTSFAARSFNFSGLNGAIGGQSLVRFRILGYNATQVPGTWRIDNVTFTLNNPTAVVLGDVDLVTASIDEVLGGLGAADMPLQSLRGLLAAWDPDAAAALAAAGGTGRGALLDALRRYLDPRGEGRVVVFRWETLEERGTVGFFVERRAGDGWTRIHSGMLPALVAAPMGAQYWMVDPGARAGVAYEYRLIELEARGATREYGPFVLEAGD